MLTGYIGIAPELKSALVMVVGVNAMLVYPATEPDIDADVVPITMDASLVRVALAL